MSAARHRKRAEFSLKTKLEAMIRYTRCPGLEEKNHKCGRPFGSITNIHFDHIARECQTHDNSVENCRPLCKECHRLKTSGTKATSAWSDVGMEAKSKRVSEKEEEFRSRLLAKDAGEAPPQQKAKAKMRGGRGDKLKVGFGKVVDRETGKVVWERGR